MRLLSIGNVLALVVGLAPACAQPSTADPLEVYIVRHAEKIRTGDSSIDNNCAPGPRLTDEGFARAMDLRELFADADIDGVFSTNCRRTIQTGILVAADHGDDGLRPSDNDDSYAPITLYDAPETLAEQFDNMTGRYLVIGHSNTMKVMIEALGAIFEGGPVVSGENDRLYTVSRNSSGRYSVSGLCSFGEAFARPEGRELPACEPIK